MRRILIAMAAACMLAGLTQIPVGADAAPHHKRTVYPEYRYRACNPHNVEGDHVHVCLTADVRRQADGTGVQADQSYIFGYGPTSSVNCDIGGSGWEGDPAILNKHFWAINDSSHTMLVSATGPDGYGTSCDIRYGFDGETNGDIQAPVIQFDFGYKARLQFHPDPDVLGLQLRLSVQQNDDGTTSVHWRCTDADLGREPDVCTRQLL